MMQYKTALGAAQDDSDGSISAHGNRATIPSRSIKLSQFPIISSLLLDLVGMSDGTPSTGKGSGRRGRKPRAKVPCDDCIARASLRKGQSATLELCDLCTAALHRPRTQKPKEQANVRKVRKQNHAVLDAALGINTEPVAMPCKLSLTTHRVMDSDILPGSSDRQEQHSLNFFVRHSAPELAGYFDSPFWEKMCKSYDWISLERRETQARFSND